MWNLFLIFAMVTSYSVYADDIKCGPHEWLDQCPFDCNEYCPTKSGESLQCEPPTDRQCPEPRCVCWFNNRRAENGTCIPTWNCPPFECTGPNEEYNPCPPVCPGDECSQATPDGRCKDIGNMFFVLQCVPSCRCKPTYWRKDGVCVPYQECLEVDNENNSVSLNETQ